MLAVAITALACPASAADDASTMRIVGEAVPFAPGIFASTAYSEIRLTLSPDGDTALWFSRDRPGGAGGYDLWMSRRRGGQWSEANPVPFNSPTRDFDPAFSADGRFIYFCSDRPGSLGGDDVYRVAVTAGGFGAVEHLDAAINSAGNEFAPMLSADGRRLLFSSDRAGGAGGHDLYVAERNGVGFDSAQRAPGEINTAANEFDATFLQDGTTLIFARAMDFRKDRVDLFASSLHEGRYDEGTRLPDTVNSRDHDTYGPMLDWSKPGRFTVSAQRAGASGMDLYLVEYALDTP